MTTDIAIKRKLTDMIAQYEAKKDAIPQALKTFQQAGKLDHGLIEEMGFKHSWRDLPVGSFRESGTNINTTVLTMHK